MAELLGLVHDAHGLAELLAELPAAVIVSYTHLRAHETVLDLVCRLLLEINIGTRMAQYHPLCCMYYHYVSVCY